MPVTALAVPHAATAGIASGLSTFTLTFGAYTDPLGAAKFVGLVGVLSLSAPLHYNGGEVQGSVAVTIGAGGTATVGPLVNPSDPQVAAQGVRYVMEWQVGRFADCPGGLRAKRFAPPAGVGVLDFDDLDTSTPPAPVDLIALAGTAVVDLSTAG